MKFQYVTISVSDLKRSRDFYTHLLGFKETNHYEDWIGYEHEDKTSGFGIIEDKGLEKRSSLDIINFIADDFESLWKEIKDKVEIEIPPQQMPWGTRKFIILDPDKMRIAFIERNKG